MDIEGLDARLLAGLAEVVVLPLEMTLDTGPVRATVPMVRGVWGAALHDAFPQAYAEVFEGRGHDRDRTVPRYVFRPAMPHMPGTTALQLVLIQEGVDYEEGVLAAWDEAAERGLDRERVPFRTLAMRVQRPSGYSREYAPGLSWPLDAAWWPLAGAPAETPCALVFRAPLRLLTPEKRLIRGPNYGDIALAAWRRVKSFLPLEALNDWETLAVEIAEAADATPGLGWEGRDLELVRYSARQEREVNMRGVVGALELPEGPGPLWPLLSAAAWLHLGRGTVMGMGELELRPFAGS